MVVYGAGYERFEARSSATRFESAVGDLRRW